MIDYSRWKEDSLHITNLLLDPHNSRIPDSGAELSQRDLIADMVENDKVHELARNIVDNGYYPVEALIVVEEEKKRYVVEGNRRLAALKLLLSPETAPEIWERRFRSLANRIDPNTIRKVKVIRAPSREAAAPVIMTKHTRGQIESWSPLMQAKFYKNLVQGGLTINDIADQYNIQPSEITEALQRYVMYSVACTLTLPEDIAKKVQNPRGFPITTLDRLYKNPQVNKFLGIDFDENKQLIGSVDVNEFKKGYSKIIIDIATGKVHSRTLNTTAEMDKYLNSFGEQKPNLSRKGHFTADTFLNVGAGLGVAKGLVVSKKKPNKPKPLPRALVPPSFPCEVDNQRINDVFNEIKKLHVAQYPNAVALMFRSLLEMSLGYYLDRTGHLGKLTELERVKRQRKKSYLPDEWHPTLIQMLQYMADNTNIINNANLLKVLRKLISQKQNLLSIDTLNLFAHNQHFYPNEDTLRGFWLQLQGVFEIILIEPDQETESE